MAFPWDANGENPIRGLILCANSISQANVIRGHIRALSLWLAGADRQRLTPEGSDKHHTHTLGTHGHPQNCDTPEEQGFPIHVNYPMRSMVLNLLALRWKEKLTQSVSLTPKSK